MQFRFREYNTDTKCYNFITYCDIEDYDTMFKALTFMKEHECEYSLELNTESVVDTLGEEYEVIGVSLCVSKGTGKNGLTPHFVVDVERCF